MLANYHTHTYRCKHATGTDEEYILKAIAEGVKILGFSDHAPYLYPNGYLSYYKMDAPQIGEYFSSLSALRKKYEDKIEIHIGYETEYYPALWEKTFDFWKSENQPEYLILGQHFIEEEYPLEKSIHSASLARNPEHLTKYVDTLITAIKTGRFTYVAHPDVVCYSENPDFFRAEISRLMTEIKVVDIPIEINLLGLAENRHYPTPLFWEIAKEYNPKVIFGCDAHEPKDLADKDQILAAKRFADKYKLEVLESIPLVNPFL